MTAEIAPTLHRSYETFVLLAASGTFSRKVKADHNPLTGMCTGREGRGCIHSQKNRLCQQTLLGIWRGGLARKTGSIAAKWRLSHPCSCYSFYMLTVAWSWIANQCNSGKLTKQFRNVDSSRSWLASSTCLSNQLTLTHTCTSLHASRMTCMHLYTSLRVHRQTKMHTKTAKIPSYTNACTADSHPDWAGKVSKHGNTGSEWSPSSALQIGIQKMWEKCVNAWGECAWGPWKEFIHQWGGQKTQSDPRCMRTKVPIRISLKGRKRRGVKHIACSMGWFWTGACRKSSLLGEIKLTRKGRRAETISSFLFMLVQSSLVQKPLTES